MLPSGGSACWLRDSSPGADAKLSLGHLRVVGNLVVGWCPELQSLFPFVLVQGGELVMYQMKYPSLVVETLDGPFLATSFNRYSQRLW